MCETMWVVLSKSLLLELKGGQAVESDRQEFESFLCSLSSFSLLNYEMKILKPISWGCYDD